MIVAAMIIGITVGGLCSVAIGVCVDSFICNSSMRPDDKDRLAGVMVIILVVVSTFTTGMVYHAMIEDQTAIQAEEATP